MKNVKLLLSCVLVGVLVALTYFVFEYAVHHSITYVWNTLLNSENTRILVIPICVVITLIFFGAQHFLDPKSENHESHGLGGGELVPTVKNFMIILSVGFFSLLAGASLGPEAILVPSSMVIGLFLGVKIFKKDTKSSKVLAAAAIMALFAAFFHSFIVGVLAIFLVTKQAKTKITPPLLIIAVVASASSWLTLKIVDPTNSYFNFPDFTWKAAFIDLLLGVGLVIAGYIATFALKYAHSAFDNYRLQKTHTKWWQQALIASLGLSLLYLLGGPLVQFTGNESISPMLKDAASLGVVGLLWIAVVKIFAISWSKAMGYRGGLVFPMIFVASTLVAISQFIYKDANFGVGLVAALIGILAAEKKAKILF